MRQDHSPSEARPHGGERADRSEPEPADRLDGSAGRIPSPGDSTRGAEGLRGFRRRLLRQLLQDEERRVLGLRRVRAREGELEEAWAVLSEGGGHGTEEGEEAVLCGAVLCWCADTISRNRAKQGRPLSIAVSYPYLVLVPAPRLLVLPPPLPPIPQNQMHELESKGETRSAAVAAWSAFRSSADRFERQRSAGSSGLAFAFAEGTLVDALRHGRWVLLDEINLASSETLQRLAGLLDGANGSVTLTERGDASAIRRHPDFRLFAAMNPATDAGKKDLPASIRGRFSEIYVDELLDPVELRFVAARYLRGAIETRDGIALEHSDTAITAVDVYLRCRSLAENSLADGAGQRPRYTLRTLCRALSAARTLVVQQKFAPRRAVLEGFELAFGGSLDSASTEALWKTLWAALGTGLVKKDMDRPARRPGGKGVGGNDAYILVKPFWIQAGPLDPLDWAEASHKRQGGRSKFVLTPSASLHLRRLARAVSSGPYPVLLEGPTSAGKTTLVEYMAARLGHRCVRINNHEHTDVQEYTGSYVAGPDGSLTFRDGILVQALRRGDWVILDELNLAPSEVLEALNRLLDDNRELYIAEIDEVVRPHPSFRLFATQNPAGAYGGRKPLSRAFRNRFVELHVGDIPPKEMETILISRCGCPPSHAKLLVRVMLELRRRRSKSGVFRGRDGLITPRDLLRWAERGASRATGSKAELAAEGYMLLAERLRDVEERDTVREVLEEVIKVEVNCDDIYYGPDSKARKQLEDLSKQYSKTDVDTAGLSVEAIAPTQSMLRLLSLVQRCIQQKEPVLLVGGM